MNQRSLRYSKSFIDFLQKLSRPIRKKNATTRYTIYFVDVVGLLTLLQAARLATVLAGREGRESFKKKVPSDSPHLVKTHTLFSETGWLAEQITERN